MRKGCSGPVGSSAPKDQGTTECHDAGGQQTSEEARLIEKNPSYKYLEDHAELEEDKGVGEQCLLKDFDREQLHRHEDRAVDEETAPVTLKGRAERG